MVWSHLPGQPRSARVTHGWRPTNQAHIDDALGLGPGTCETFPMRRIPSSRVSVASILPMAWVLACSPRGPERVPVTHPPPHAPAAAPGARLSKVRSTDELPRAPDREPAAKAAVVAPGSKSTAPVLKNVNLLQMVPARIAVSSAVRNPHDFPEYLVDNHLETAWNSQTGDLVGGWIDFQIPNDAMVHSIEMTCGFSRVKGKSDLFVLNHRISRVEVIRNGQKLGEFALDVNQRGLQKLAISGGGGTYRIIVKATVPGKRRDWRELVVSELRVMGDPGNELRRPGDRLQVAVGSLENASPEEFRTSGMAIRELDPETQAFPNPEQLCAHFVKQAQASAAELLNAVSGIGIDKLEPPFCRVTAEEYPIPANRSFHRAIALLLSNGLSTQRQLAVKVQRGYVLFPVFWASVDPTDPGCPSIFRTERLEPLRVENGYLVTTETGSRFLGMSDKNKPMFAIVHGATWCKEADAKLTCFAYDPSNLGSLEGFAIAPDGMLHIQGRGAN